MHIDVFNFSLELNSAPAKDLFSLITLCVCMYRCACIYVYAACVCVHVGKCMYLHGCVSTPGSKRSMLGFVLSHSPLHSFWDRISHWMWSSLIWLPRCDPGILCPGPPLPMLGMQRPASALLLGIQMQVHMLVQKALYWLSISQLQLSLT